MTVVSYKSLSFQNGYMYRHCELPLANQGLTLIRGLNVDDGGYLGAGKTSIPEVFSRLQIGKGGKQGKGERHKQEDIINREVGKDFVGALRLDVDERPLEIRHYLQHHQYGNHFEVIDLDSGHNILPHNARRYPHKWIREELLHIDEKSFLNFVYLAQNFSNVMLNGTDGDRAKAFTEMFELDVYDKLLDLVKKRIALLGTQLKDIEQLEQELDNIKVELTALPAEDVLQRSADDTSAYLTAFTTAHDSAVEQLDTLQSVLRDLELRSVYIKEARTLWIANPLPELQDPRRVTQRYCDKIQTMIEETNQRLGDLRSAIDQVGKRDILTTQLQRLTGRDLAEIETSLIETKSTLRELQNVELPQAEQREELLKDLQKLSAPPKSIPKDASKLRDKLRSAQQTMQNTIKSITTQLEHSICPTCKRPLDISTEEAEALQTQLEQERDKLRQVSDKLRKLSKAIESLEEHRRINNQLKTIITKRTPAAVQDETRSYLRQEKDLLAEQELSRRKAELEAQLAALPQSTPQDLEQEEQQLTTDLKARRQQHSTATAILDRLQRIAKLQTGKVQETQQQVQRLQDDIKKLAPQLAETSKQAALTEQHLTRVQELTARQQKIEKGLLGSSAATKELQCLEALKYAFGARGLKLDRFHRILHDAAEITVPAYVNTLWPQQTVNIELAEEANNLRFSLRRKDGELLEAHLISGGERHKSGLALLFGMRDLKELYTGTQVNVLIVDEPFGNLDPLGRDSLLRIFVALKERFGSVFVISHRPEVLDSDVWDQILWVVRENNEAKLYREEPPARYLQLAQQYKHAM